VLQRAFRHVKSFDSPIVFPKVPGKSYPQPNGPEWRHRSDEFEALERTFNLAAPLIHVDPEISIGNIRLRDYYCHHFYNALTPGHANSLPMPEDLPDATYQFTCEFGGLTKTLLLMPDVLWPYLTETQRMKWQSQFPSGRITGRRRTTGGCSTFARSRSQEKTDMPSTRIY